VFAASLCIPHLSATSAEDAMRALAGRLVAAGHVLDSFEAAALARERRSPTGLPFAGGAIALPHAEPEHVVSPAIAMASLAAPVRFRQMGSPGIALDVALIVMPAFSAKEQAAAGLAQLLEQLRDDALRAELARATTPDAMHAAIAARWNAGR
jgi:galactitol PTS system EIIA component